jgi:hypothetical protein
LRPDTARFAVSDAAEFRDKSMSGLELLGGTFALPLWALIAAALLLLILAVLAGTRGGWQKAIVSSAQFAAVVGLLFLAWNYFDRMTTRDAADERRAFQARLAEINVRAIAPGSPLACLDALAGQALDEVCEKAVFANPESVAAAVSLMAARWSLLRDAVALAAHDVSYDAAIADLRRSIEMDRFGFAAQAVAAREQCTAESCEALSLLADPARVAANLKERTFDVLVGRHVAAWLGRAPAPAVATVAGQGAPAAAPGAQAAASPATSSINVDFPSAASIPPVSIMTNEPGQQQGGTDPEPKASQPRKSTATPLPTPRRASNAGNAAPPASAATPATPPTAAQ